MRVAAIDVGTNTIVFLVAEKTDAGIVALHDEADIVRLGEGVDRTRRLAPQAIARALDRLEKCANVYRRLGVDRVGVVGTQALREVDNARDFLEPARTVLGVDVEIIDGKREAALSWRAAASSFPLGPTGRRTVVDIGGGSTEILVGGREAERAVSIPIGAVRLTERHVGHDPPTDAERRALVAAIDAALDGAPAPEGDLVGIAGTVTTLCAIALGMRTYDGARVHGTRLSRRQVEAVVDDLGRRSVAERRELPGLDPRRADVIYAGGTILARVLARAPVDEVIVSDRGIRWGLAEEMLSAATRS